MSKFLEGLRSITRRLPRLRGVGRIILSIQKPLVLLSRSHRHTVTTLGSTMELDIRENVDYKLMLIPQIYDHVETRFLEENVKKGNVFVDIGGHVGMYACLAARLVGPDGKVVSIEADPINFERLIHNLKLNDYLQATAVNIGVSDKEETLNLYVNTTGNRSGNTFLKEFSGRKSIEVQVRKLNDVLKENGIEHIDFMKIDIEGYEYKVLSEFFKSTDRDNWPKFIITEYHPTLEESAGGDTMSLLETIGYAVVIKNGINYIMELKK